MGFRLRTCITMAAVALGATTRREPVLIPAPTSPSAPVSARDRACCPSTGASHFYASQCRDVPPQLDALRPDTRLVTLTIGGNDNNTFLNAILAGGSAGLATFGRGSPCAKRYGTTFDDQIEANTYRHQEGADRHQDTITAGADRDPGDIRGCCPDQGLVRHGAGGHRRRPLPDNLQAHLNDVMARAAVETGATFIDFAQVSEGHDACARPSTRWVEPVVGTRQFAPAHPNALGERKMAEQTMSILGL